MFNRTEIYVQKFSKTIKVYDSHQLMISIISKRLNLSVVFWDFEGETTLYNGSYEMFIDNKIDSHQQWQDFGHEMYHYHHDYVSYDLPKENYAKYGESKADYFAYHFCVPLLCCSA